MYRFQRPESEQTLREAMAEFGHVDALVAEQRKSSKEAKEFFSSHDACHVLFGLDTSLDQEALVDTWMLFGTTATFKDFMRYIRLEEHQEIIKRNSYYAVIKTFFRSLPNIMRVIWHSRKMPEKWPWHAFEEFLDFPLADLRSRFNVRLIGVETHRTG